MRRFDYAVVGMGIGGLSMAALLANSGRRVIVLEQGPHPGGYAQTFRVGDFSFCCGLHYVWGCHPGGSVHRMLRKLGLAGEVEFRQLDPAGFDRVVAPGIDYTIGNGFDVDDVRFSQIEIVCFP